MSDDHPGAPVEAALLVVGLRPELHARHVPHPHQRAVGLGPDHDVLEVLDARQAALRAHRVGELLALRHGLGADLAGRVHGVLGLQRADDLVHRDVQLPQGVGVDPEPDGVLAGAEDLHLADAGDARHRVVDVDVGVVAEEELVISALRGVQHEDPQRAGHGLLDRHALVDDVGGELRGGLRVPQVGQHLVVARVGVEVEVHAQLHLAAAGLAGRVHVEHVVHAAHLLLDGRGDRLLERQRVGAGVGRREQDLGRGDVRILRDGQLDHGDDADDHHEDGDDHRHDGPVDEELGHASRSSACVVRSSWKDGAASGGPRLPPRPGGFGSHRRGLHHGTGSHVLQAGDDDPLAGLEPLGDDPEGAHAWPDLDRADLHRVVRPDHAHLELPLHVLHGPLGHEERAGLQAGGGAHFGILAGPQQGLGIREHAPDAEGPRREADVAVQGIEPPTVGEGRAVDEDEIEGDVLHPPEGPRGGRVVAQILVLAELEVDVDRIEGRHRGEDRLILGHHLPEVDVAQPGEAVDGGGDLGPAEVELGVVQGGLRRRHVGLGSGDVRLRLLDVRLHAEQVGAGGLYVGAGRLDRGLIGEVVLHRRVVLLLADRAVFHQRGIFVDVELRPALVGFRLGHGGHGLGDLGLGLLDLGLRLGELGPALFELRLRQGEVGLVLIDGGLVRPGVDPKQQVPGLHEGALGVVLAHEVARNAGADLRGDVADRGADPLGVDGDILLDHLCDLDLRRLLGGGDRRGLLAPPEERHAEQHQQPPERLGHPAGSASPWPCAVGPMTLHW